MYYLGTLPTTPWDRPCCHSHLTGEETQSRRACRACSSQPSHSSQVTSPGFRTKWLPVGFSQWEALAEDGSGEDERSQAFLSSFSAVCGFPPDSHHSSPSAERCQGEGSPRSAGFWLSSADLSTPSLPLHSSSSDNQLPALNSLFPWSELGL